MGKIGDLWVKLSVKNDDYKKGIKESKKETTGFMSSLKNMKAGALAIWGAVGAGVLALGKEIINTSNKFADAWAQNMSGMKNAWQTFKGQVLSGNFKDLGKNIKEAFTGGKEAEAAFDEEFEVMNTLALKRAKMAAELEQLRIDMMDPGKSAEERIRAGRKYLAMQEDLYKREIALREKMKNAHIDKWLAGTGVKASREDVDKFFTNYTGPNSDIAKQFPELARVYENLKGDAQNKPVVDAILAYERAQSAYTEENRRIIQQLNTLGVKGEKEESLLAQTLYAIEQSIDEDIEEAQKVLDDEMKILTMPEIDTSAFDRAEARIDEFVAQWAAEQAEIAQLNGMLENAIVSSMGGGLEAITDALAGIEGADAKGVLAALLQPFAQTATQLGEMLIVQGLGIKAFKESLKSLNPAVAIGAGVALLALGAALSTGIKKLGNGPSTSGGGVDTSGYGSSYTPQYATDNMAIEVYGKISGSDIEISSKNTKRRWED